MYHHAIVLGVTDDEIVQVIHYAGPPGGNRGATSSFSSLSSSSLNRIAGKKSSVMIRMDKVNLNKYAIDGKLKRVDYEHNNKCYPADEVISRARGMYGKPGLQERRYNLFKNNCEHFATWCKTGKAFSVQSGQRTIN